MTFIHISLFVYKALNNLASQYLNDLPYLYTLGPWDLAILVYSLCLDLDSRNKMILPLNRSLVKLLNSLPLYIRLALYCIVL